MYHLLDSVDAELCPTGLTTSARWRARPLFKRDAKPGGSCLRENQPFSARLRRVRLDAAGEGADPPS